MMWWLGLALAQSLPPEVQPPLREDRHPFYLDVKDRTVAWSDIRPVARRTDVMGRVRRRRAGRTTLRLLFTGAAVAEGFATHQLVRDESVWAGVMGVQTGFTALAAGLLWADIPRSHRIDRAEMLAAANAYLASSPSR